MDERLNWRKEKAALEAEVRMMKKEAEERTKRDQALQLEQQSSKFVKAENERLTYGWTVMTEQYAELYEVSKQKEREWRETSRTMESEKRRLESDVALLETVLSTCQAELEDLKLRVDESRGEAEMLVGVVDDLRAARDHQIQGIPIPPIEPAAEDLEPQVDISDVRQFLDLTTGHIDLLLSDTSDVPSHIATLTGTILTIDSELRQCRASLVSLESSKGRVDVELETVKVDHATCGATTSQLRFELDQAEQIIESRGREVSEVRLALNKANERAEKHAELLARATEQATRSKFAEEALEEEVTQYVPLPSVPTHSLISPACKTSISRRRRSKSSITNY